MARPLPYSEGILAEPNSLMRFVAKKRSQCRRQLTSASMLL